MPSIKNINYRFKKGCLVGITGKVGSGKSSFLKAIVKEMPYFSGQIKMNGSIALFEQEPFIFSDTVRNNILFGKKYDRAKYEEAVRASCLVTDFKLLAMGDQTIIGEKGATLSGGQKARVSLARCVYSNIDILLLDDPLSAVDSKVAKEIFKRCIRPLSREKTVILSTHQIGFLHEVDEVIILDDGAIVEQGTPAELNRRLKQLTESQTEEEKEEEDARKEDPSPFTSNRVSKMVS